MAFDRNKELAIRIVSGGLKACSVKYPTDAQWCDRSRRLKLVRQQVTGGVWTSVPQNSVGVDSALFETIRVDKDGEQWAAEEAVTVIERLDAARVTEIELFGDSAEIGLEAMKQSTRHRLKLPTKPQLMRHERGSSAKKDRGRQTEVTVFLEPSGELYDQLLIRHEGYVGEGAAAVPINHKFAVVYELLADIERLEADDPELLTLAAGRSGPAFGL